MDQHELKDLCHQKISDMSDCVWKISSNISDLEEAFKDGTDSEKLEIARSHIIYANGKIKRYSYLENELYNLLQDLKIFTKDTKIPEKASTSQPSSSVQLKKLSITGKESSEEKSTIQTFKAATKMESENSTYLESYQETMAKFYGLANTDYRIINFNGFYPKLHFVQGADPKEIRDAYEFGMLSEIYLTSPDFPELSKLPIWIQKGVRDNFNNNPYITMEDVLRLNCFSAGPDFDAERSYPAYNLMILGKSFRDSLTVSGQRKNYTSINDAEVHRKRATELFSIKTRLENIRKRPYRSYSSGEIASSILITQLARHTPESAERFVLSVIKMIDENLIPSGEATHKRYCQRSHYKKDLCRFCRQRMSGSDDDRMSES